MRRAAPLACALVVGVAVAGEAPPKTTRGLPEAAPKTVPTKGAAAVPPIPKPGRLAGPASPDEKGYPADLARAVLPGGPPPPALVDLGRRLFFDGRLSADGTVACATCHDPDKGFTDRRATSIGIGGQVGHRNAPTVLNAMWNVTQFWDGRAATLEDQAKLPIVNPIEMGRKSHDEVVAALQKTEYADQFRVVLGKPVDIDGIARALAAFERTEFAFDAPFDRFLAGDENALDASARRGWTVFNGRGRCMSCHPLNLTSPLATDNRFHNIGVSAHKQDFVALARRNLAALQQADTGELDRLALETDSAELGRFLVTRRPEDVGAFKTPTLRNVLVTAPYFHDGSQDTLWDVVDHYDKGGVQNPFLDGGIQRLGLGEGEIDDLVAFMASLTSSRYAAIGRAELARQRAIAARRRPQRDTAAADGKDAQGPGLKGPFGDPVPVPAKMDPARIGTP